MRIASLLSIIILVVSVCQGLQLDVQQTDCRDSGELKFPTHEVDPSCLHDADSGGCRFYECFERRFPCDTCGFAKGYGKNVCERFHNPSYLSRFDDNGKLWVNSTNRCILATLKEIYKRSAISCDMTTTTLMDRISVCNLRNDVDISICDVAEVNRNALLGVFATGEFVNSHRIFTELVQLIANCAASNTNSPIKLAKQLTGFHNKVSSPFAHAMPMGVGGSIELGQNMVFPINNMTADQTESSNPSIGYVDNHNSTKEVLTSGPPTGSIGNKFLFQAGEGVEKPVDQMETETRSSGQVFNNIDFGVKPLKPKRRSRLGSSARGIGKRINRFLKERRNRINKRIKDINSRFNQSMINLNLSNNIRSNTPIRNFISNTRRRIGTRVEAIGDRIKAFLSQDGNKNIEQRVQAIMSRPSLPKLNELMQKIDTDVRNRELASKTMQRIEMFAKNVSDSFRSILSSDVGRSVLDRLEPFVSIFNKTNVDNNRFTGDARSGGKVGNLMSNASEGIKPLSRQIKKRNEDLMSRNGKPIRKFIQQIVQRINQVTANDTNKTEFGGRFRNFVENARNKFNEFFEENGERLREFLSDGRRRFRELLKQRIDQNTTNGRFVNDTAMLKRIRTFVSKFTNENATDIMNKRVGDIRPIDVEELTGQRLTQQAVQSTKDGHILGNVEFGGRIRNILKKTKDRIVKSSLNMNNRIKHMMLEGGNRIRKRVQHLQNKTRNGQLVNNTDLGGRIQDFFSNTRNRLNKYAKQIRNKLNSNFLSEVVKRKINILPIVNPNEDQMNSVTKV